MTPLRQGEGVAARRFGPWQAADVAAYAAASGDDNPLHVDPAVAAAAGLPRPPVHGMLLMGCFEPFLKGWRPEVRVVRLSGKFIRPVLTGEAVEVSGKVVRVGTGGDGAGGSGEPAVVRLTVKRDADLVCLAEAFVRVDGA